MNDGFGYELEELAQGRRGARHTTPVVAAGDLNADRSRSQSSAAVLERLGFHSAIASPAAHTTKARSIFRRRIIDSVYLAGPVESISGGVRDDVNASDHYPLWFDLKLTAA